MLRNVITKPSPFRFKHYSSSNHMGYHTYHSNQRSFEYPSRSLQKSTRSPYKSATRLAVLQQEVDGTDPQSRRRISCEEKERKYTCNQKAVVNFKSKSIPLSLREFHGSNPMLLKDACPQDVVSVVVQNNHLKQLKGSEKWQFYRCRSCLTLTKQQTDCVDISAKEAMSRLEQHAEKVHKIMHVIRNRTNWYAGSEKCSNKWRYRIQKMLNHKSEQNEAWFQGAKCPKCGSKKLQWLQEWIHRSIS